MKIKIVNLPNGDKRIISGKLLDKLDLDYTQKLSDLKRDIEFALSALERKQSLFDHLFTFSNKNVLVYQGGHHLDIVDDENGSLGWLMVEDHWHGFFQAASELNDDDLKNLDEIFPPENVSSSTEKPHA